jgi:phage host-nuclease inhibitor protein Gam
VSKLPSPQENARARTERIHELNQIGGLQEENARLKAEVERLTAFTTRTIIPNEELQAENARLKAEVERLRTAGDTLVAAYCMGDRNKERWAEYPVVREWLVAKGELP